MNYIKTGQGNQTLVLIHGFCENNTCFNKQVLFFKDYCKLIIPDLPGFGESKLQSDTSLENMANEIQQILLKEKIENCIMLGHSMGGYVALAFAKKFPEMLNGFGLIHSTAYNDSPDRIAKRKQVIKFIEKEGVETYVKNFIPSLFHSEANLEEVDFAVKMAIGSSKAGVINAVKAMMNRANSIELLKNTWLPVFFGVGKFDQLIPEEILFEQASFCSISQVVYLENSAHMSQLEQSEELNAGILKFMKLCDANKEY